MRKWIPAMLIIGFMAALVFVMTRLPGSDHAIATQTPQPPRPTQPIAMPPQTTAMHTRTPLPGSMAHVAVVASTALHLRACPDVSCQVIAWLAKGESVLAMHCQAGWAALPGGWVNARYLTPDPCKELP